MRRWASYRYSAALGLLAAAPFPVGIRWKRLAFITALFPFVLAGGASGGYYLRLHHTSSALTLTGLPLAPEPAQGRRILVLSPHCDDETLGVGGMIADARRAGVPVTVAFLTNGDGFPFAAGRALGEVRLSPNDYVRFAEKRQTESVAALQELGVPEKNVLFLGYPDRGLSALWGENWEPSRPFRSSYTRHTRSPYKRSYTPRAVHCGRSLLNDLVRLMEATQPTDIYVTHPADDHPDHTTGAAFAQAALMAARDRDQPWAGRARLRYYLIHRGDWPLPQGMRPEKPLLPPAGLRGLDTRWEVYPLPPETRDRKARALAHYHSQMSVPTVPRFLGSFVRENELFGELPEAQAPLVPAGKALWSRIPSAPDAVRDDLVRYADAAADLRSLSVCREKDALRVRLTTRGPVSRRVRYTLRLRVQTSGGDNAQGTTQYRTLNLPARVNTEETSKGTWFATRGNTLEARLLLEELAPPDSPPHRVWVSVETHRARVPVDRMGFRPFSLDNSSQAARL